MMAASPQTFKDQGQSQTLDAWGRAALRPPGSAPEHAWIVKHRAAAQDLFLQTGFPRANSDDWRHMGLDALLKPSWRAVEEAAHLELPAGSTGVDVERWDRLDRLPDFAERKSDSGPFAHLNSLFFKQATHVRVNQNVCSLQPLRIAPAPVDAGLVSTDPAVGDWMIHPRFSMVLEAGSRLDVILDCGKFLSAGRGAGVGLINWVMDIELKEQTALNLVICGPGAGQVLNLLDIAVTQRRDSVFRAFCFETRPRQSRVALSVSLEGENASTDLFGLALLGEDSRAFHHLRVDHRVPRTQSQQVFKSILSGTSRFEYDSLVTIHPEAPHASSEQLNKNLVLSDGARAFARPQLAIHTDEVQCHHGATVGQMNLEELLYLRTRGIDPGSASQLVLRGFVDDLLKEIPVSAVAAELQKQARERLEEIVR